MSSKPSHPGGSGGGRTDPPQPEDARDPSESPGSSTAVVPFEGLDHQLAEELPTFELFFKTFGFKRVHGRIWGLLVLAGQPLSSREISESLSLSQGSTSTAVNELVEWGAVSTEFDSSRRCHLHSPVRNTLAIVATVIRRREQVVFSQFKQASSKTLAYVTQRYGDKDPRVLTLRSIVSTCEIAEAVMNLVVSSVANALDDSQSLLHKAISAALRVGAVPGRLLIPGPRERFVDPDRPRRVAGPRVLDPDAAADEVDPAARRPGPPGGGLDLPPTQDREAAGGR